MSQSDLNWLDKTVWALAKFTDGEMQYNIPLSKFALAIGLFITLLGSYAFCYQALGIVPSLPWLKSWGEVLLPAFLALCYGLVHLATSPTTKIEAADLSTRQRWAYTALGLFLFVGIWILLIVMFAIWGVGP